MPAPVRDPFEHENLNRLNALVATMAGLGDMHWLPNVDLACNLPAEWEEGDLVLVEGDGCVRTWNTSCCCWAVVS